MNRSNINILLVSSELPPLPGGIGNHAHNFAGHLQNLGYKVTVLADSRTFSRQEETEFDTRQAYGVYRIQRRKKRLWMYLNRVKVYRKLLPKADVVMASGKFSLWLVGFGSFGFRRPKLAILHGTEVNFQKYGLKWSVNQALKCFDKAIAVSHFTASLIKEIPLKVKVIPNGITLEEWQWKEPIEKKHEDAFPRLITVGNLTERKGQSKVIEKLPHLLKRYPNIRYDCVGLPTELDTLQKLAKKLGVEKHVYFCGRLSEMELREKLSKSDVFVMLSQQTKTGDVEGFGIAILEANALGIPAIGAEGSGIEDTIQNGKSGFLVDKESQEAFTRALETILTNKGEFRTGALQWARQHDWKVIVKRYQEVIEELIRETK